MYIYQNAYDHQTFQGDGMLQGGLTHIYIYIYIYDEVTNMRSHDCLTNLYLYFQEVYS